MPDNDPRAIARRNPKPAASTAPGQSNIRNLHGGGGAGMPRMGGAGGAGGMPGGMGGLADMAKMMMGGGGMPGMKMPPGIPKGMMKMGRR